MNARALEVFSDGRCLNRSALRVVCSATTSGILEAGTFALNPGKGKKERIGRLMLMHANSREDVKIAFAGDIVAIGGLKDVVTGERHLFLAFRP